MTGNFTTTQSKAATKRRKTAYPLPYDGFPLSPHVPTGRWYKTHKGRRFYFGKLENWEAALAKYERDWPQILQGRRPRPDSEEQEAEGLTLATGVNRWLAARVEDSESGVIAASTLRTYYTVAGWILEHLGRQTPISWLGPNDFRRLGRVYAERPGTQARKAMTVTRQVFRWLHENEHIPAPPRFGSDFRLGKLASRQTTQRRGKAGLFTADQVRALLAAAESGVEGHGWKAGEKRQAGVAPSVQLRAMILLAINGGYTQAELGALRLEDVDLEAGIIEHRRAKTGARRTVPLWAETVEALRAAKENRPATVRAEARGLLFVTKRGWPWVRERVHVDEEAEGKDRLRTKRIDSITLQFNKLLTATGIKTQGVGFGKLRHTHRTVSDEAGDPHAAMRIMGHDVPGISRHYVQDISRERLEAVVNHVRLWLWPELAKPAKKKKGTKKKGAKKASK